MEKIALIQGGPGVERDISLITGGQVSKALSRLKIPFTILEANTSLYEKLNSLKPTKAFLAVHGPYGEDGALQGMLEHLKIPYTGSGVLASALCMDKIFFKKYISCHQIPTPKFKVFVENAKNILNPPFLPCVVKPNRSGSSIGISICRSPKDWQTAVNEAFKIDSTLLVEEHIEGAEIAVSWLDGKVLPLVEIETPKKYFYDFKRKYEKGQTRYFLPPRFSNAVVEKLKHTTRKIQNLTDVRSYCRVDFIIDKKNKAQVLELNTLPGLTPLSLLPMSAKKADISYDELVLRILNQAALDSI